MINFEKSFSYLEVLSTEEGLLYSAGIGDSMQINNKYRTKIKTQHFKLVLLKSAF